MKRVLAKTKYFVYGVCVNTALNVKADSQAFDKWEMGDNQGKPVIANITFSEPLKPELLVSTCAAYAIATLKPCNITLCPHASNACPGSGNALGGTPVAAAPADTT